MDSDYSEESVEEVNKPSTLRGGGGKVLGEKCNVAVVRWWQGVRTTDTMCH